MFWNHKGITIEDCLSTNHDYFITYCSLLNKESIILPYGMLL